MPKIYLRFAGGVVALLLVGLAVRATYLLVARAGLTTERQVSTQRLEVYAGSLQSNLMRFDYLPAVLALSESIVEALADPKDAAAVSRANAYLETVTSEARASAIYVMDLRGVTITSSNWSRPESFVGMNFHFRPYFQEAVRGGLGRFYGVGTVSQEAGYYFASGIYERGRMIGVAAVKVNLGLLDHAWENPSEVVLVLDQYKVAFLSSLPALKFRAMRPLSQEALTELNATRQYHTHSSFAPMGLQQCGPKSGDAEVVRFDSPNQGLPSHLVNSEYLLNRRQVPGTHWELVVLSDLAPIAVAARNAAAAAGFGAVALVTLVLYALQRRRVTAHRLAAKATLELAYGDLESKISERTEDLRQTNARLEREVVERGKAEKALKDTLDELVQAGKLASLGQIAASVSHEINQPLAALRTLSDNTVVLLQRGRIEEAEVNLTHISEQVSRMGRITAQLKSFIRKSALEVNPTDVRRVIADVVFLIGPTLEANQVSLVQTFPNEGPCMAICDSNRLQQVLLNLINNAIDAMADVARRALQIQVTKQSGYLSIAIRDTGSGIAPEVAQRLFEPFVTTKAQGSGLGLGLAISAGIIKEVSGTLCARNILAGGAEFTIRLKLATEGLQND